MPIHVGILFYFLVTDAALIIRWLTPIGRDIETISHTQGNCRSSSIIHSQVRVRWFNIRYMLGSAHLQCRGWASGRLGVDPNESSKMTASPTRHNENQLMYVTTQHNSQRAHNDWLCLIFPSGDSLNSVCIKSLTQRPSLHLWRRKKSKKCFFHLFQDADKDRNAL